MRKQLPFKVKPAVKRSQHLKKRRLVILFVLLSIAIAVIYVRDWPRQTVSVDPVPLDGTGLSPDVAAMLNRRGNHAAPIPRPAITPQTADEFAGVRQDPMQRYAQMLPRPNAKH